MLRRLRRQAPDDDAATLSAALVRRVVEGVVSQARAEGLEDSEDATTAALATTRQRHPPLSPPSLERCEVSGERLHVAWRQPDGGEAAEWVVFNVPYLDGPEQITAFNNSRCFTRTSSTAVSPPRRPDSEVLK